MWYSKSKYQRIGALVRTSCKRLKAVLVFRVKKLGLTFLVANLDEFSNFDDFLD